MTWNGLLELLSMDWREERGNGVIMHGLHLKDGGGVREFCICRRRGDAIYTTLEPENRE